MPSQLPCPAYGNFERSPLHTTSEAGDQLLDESPVLKSALCKLRRLKSLELCYPNAGLLALLPHLRSSPRHISVVQSYDDPSGGVQPLPSLAPFKSSLKSFSLSTVHATAPPLVPGEPLSNVRQLNLTNSSMVHIAPFVTTFPNPRRVFMDSISEYILPLPEEQDLARAANIQAQEAARWPALDLLSGDLHSLYIHAVQAPARTLCVWDCRTEVRQVEMLGKVLSDARPERLHYHAFPFYDPSRLSRALEASPPLSHLSLNLSLFYTNPDNFILPGTVESIVEAASRHPLTSLAVRLRRHDTFFPKKDNPEQKDDNPNTLFVAALDLAALARRLVQAVPTLRRIFLTMPTRGAHAWEVSGEGSTRVPRQLGYRAMLAAARKEGVAVRYMPHWHGSGIRDPLMGTLRTPVY
ncbi:hypothetical protein OF83DRAFT_1080285 [Amylostereum chailletii]|nr:hypothetical protein OF83DRAFT_1080285 [Amylostereum chailletii]